MVSNQLVKLCLVNLLFSISVKVVGLHGLDSCSGILAEKKFEKFTVLRIEGINFISDFFVLSLEVEKLDARDQFPISTRKLSRKDRNDSIWSFWNDA